MYVMRVYIVVVFFFQAEDGIRGLVRSRGLGDVYKRQVIEPTVWPDLFQQQAMDVERPAIVDDKAGGADKRCLLYTSDAADERSSVDLGGRRIIKKKKNTE